MAVWFPRFEECRERAGFTHQEVADFLGCHPMTISGYERGIREPDLTTLVHLAAIYNTSVDEILCTNVTAAQKKEDEHTMTDREIEKILQEEPDEAKVAAAVHEYRQEHRERFFEDKQMICYLLTDALKATRDQHDLKKIVYNRRGQDDEIVSIIYENGSKNVNVSMDSGIAMIRDILRAIS